MVYFDIEDVPMEVAVLFIVMGVMLQVFWFLNIFGDLSIFTFFVSLSLFTVAGYRFTIAVKNWFDSGDSQRYIRGQLSRLEERMNSLEHSYAKFQRLMLDYVDRLKAQSSNVTTSQKLEKAVPTKEELQLLKSQLGIGKGSLQHRGNSIYLVNYDPEAKKHQWKRLGTWSDLKQKLQGEKASE